MPDESDGHDDPSTGPVATAAPAEEPSTRRRPLKRSTRIALIVIAVVAVLAVIAFAVSYVVVSSRYVSTDNAQIDGTQIPIVAPAAGTLVGWSATQGTVLRRDEPVGRVQLQGAYVQPQLTIRAPAAGTVAVDDTTDGAFVTAGTQLAIAYDMSDLTVTARVDETDIDQVRVGAPVDISVDAYPDVALTGSVREIQNGASGVFSPLPQANSSGNFQKVTQVIPVKISIDDPRGLDLIPGMNVTADISRDGARP
ncbi:HlyD family secretion protein [Actinomycetospora flava]|uniref:HlyD family efflux transporter periplasmic adaptor subunit n=1 Tax=Actinomycetospora flava TaxID=3129232 RepID=A0ABU8M973_9PSEU